MLLNPGPRRGLGLVFLGGAAGRIQSITQLVKSTQRDGREGPAGPHSSQQPHGASGDRYPQLSMHRDAWLVWGNAEVLAGQPELPAGDRNSQELVLDFKMFWNGLIMDRKLVLMR